MPSNPPSFSQTLEMDTPHLLGALYCGDEKLLRVMEKKLHLTITTRLGWMKFSGEEEHVKKGIWVFQQLQVLHKKRGSVTRYEFLDVLHQSTLEEKVARFERIRCSSNKPPIIPQNQAQQDYLKTIEEHDLTFGLGAAGTGKTYLAVAKAVQALKEERVSHLILSRPAVEAGEALGFLPGELQEKIFPYLRPLYDALHDMLEPDEIKRYMDKNMIQIAPLAYMRGRTLSNAFVILDEAQNTTQEQMLMFLTRLGKGSRCVITGDHTQVDLPKNRPSGLLEALSVLKKEPGIAFHFFKEEDVVRHSLVRAIIHAYQRHRSPEKKKSI